MYFKEFFFGSGLYICGMICNNIYIRYKYILIPKKSTKYIDNNNMNLFRVDDVITLEKK